MVLFNRMLVIAMGLILAVFGYLFFSQFEKTTFAAILEKRGFEYADIETIYIEKRADDLDDSLVVQIEEPALISKIMQELSAIKLRKQPTKDSRMPDNMLTVQNGFVSHSFRFDNEYLIAESKDHRILEGSFIDAVNNLGNEVEWKTREERFEEE